MGKRIYACDFDYFETIDTEEKAYWLGFIFADGYMFDIKRIRHLVNGDSISIRKGLKISLKDEDSPHLEKLLKCLNSNNRISHYKNNNGHSYCRITIENKKIFNDLFSLGCVPRKSLIVKYPIGLNEDLNRHFIRGYFDGNGCICFNFNLNKKYEECNLTSTKEMLEVINNLLPIEGNWSKRKDNGTNNYTLRFQGGNKIETLLRYLYDDCSIYLDRKYNKYKEWLVLSGRA